VTLRVARLAAEALFIRIVSRSRFHIGTRESGLLKRVVELLIRGQAVLLFQTVDWSFSSSFETERFSRWRDP
jgi:hypothetical protein